MKYSFLYADCLIIMHLLYVKSFVSWCFNKILMTLMHLQFVRILITAETEILLKYRTLDLMYYFIYSMS